jgi:formylmethanofuran dehydrogenase subunit B
MDAISPPVVVENATCLACGCLCDDIRVVVEAGRIVEAERACVLGRPWFLEGRLGEGFPAATIAGASVDIEVALVRAVDLLANAKAPVVWGLGSSTVEAQRQAVAIADTLGAVLDPVGSPDELTAFQRVGAVSASLGEVKARADVVLFWGVDPLTTHPRFAERYALEPRSRFLPEGRNNRLIIVIDDHPTATAAISDLCVHVPIPESTESLRVLRALVRGIPVDRDRFEASSGVALEALEDLARRLTGASYGALVFDPSIGAGAIEAALLLVRDLNQGRRFVAVALGEPGNRAGAASVATWQAGAPGALDFASGIPRHLPGDATLAVRLTRGEADAALIVGDDPAKYLDAGILEKLAAISTVVIAPGATRHKLGTVAIDVARPGIESPGTVQRTDGVMLPLRPALRVNLPDEASVLAVLLQRIIKNPSDPSLHA